MCFLCNRMTHITWIITSLLLSLFVGLTVSCSKLANGNRMKKIGDVRSEHDLGKRSYRTQGQRLSIAEFTRRARNRRNLENDYDSYSSSASLDDNAIYPEVPGLVHDQVQTPQQQEQIFRAADTDDDGRVSLKEFRESPGYPGDEPFITKDRNGDGFVTLEEFFDQVLGYPQEIPAEIFNFNEIPTESICSTPKYKGERCEDCIMEVCDFQFINATQCVGEDLSPLAICNSFQVYIDCIARESSGCEAKNFTNKILSIASGLKGDGECPDLHLSALRRPDYVLPRMDVYSPGGTDPELQELPRRNHEPLLPHGMAYDPTFPVYGSGNKQEDFDLGGFNFPLTEFLTDLDMTFPGGELDTESSSSSSSYTNIEEFRLNKHKENPVRTSHTEETTTVKELFQLQYDETDSSSRDNVQQSATPSWEVGTRRTHHRHRHHHTSHLQTQSTEQLKPLHIRQVRSSTTKRRPIEKSRSRSRGSNCKVSTIKPCNYAFISALAQGDADPCESLVRFRHCVHKSTRHCTDTNVYKINEGLKYLSKEHRRAKLCGQIRITL